MGYNAKEWEKHSRVQVAARAIQRLLASCSPETCIVKFAAGPSAQLFIAKKGDKHQKRQVMNKSWQTAFLTELEKHGALKSSVDNGAQSYSLNKSMLENIKNGTGSLCIHTVLWPDIPCTFDHTAAAETVTDKPTGLEQEILEGRLEILEERKQEISKQLASAETEQAEISEKLEAAKKTEAEGVPEVPVKEEMSVGTEEALKGLYDLCTNISDLLIVHGKTHDLFLKGLTKIAGEFEHIHSKVDKLHDENVHLRRESEANTKSLEGMFSLLKELQTQINPDDTVVGAVKKRLTELEKLATEHRDLLDAGNKFLKNSMTESAKTMVDAAAKAFIQVDHSLVLTKMEGVEEIIVDAQTRTDKALTEVYAALEKVRAEYKNSTRVPAIIDRMTTITAELQRLQTILPELPAQVKIVEPDLSGI